MRRTSMYPLMLVSALSIGVTGPREGVLAAYKDASSLPPKDRYYVRYLHWPEGWDHQRILTRAQHALLSDQGKFPNLYYVGANTYRLDARESGWDRDKGRGKLTGLQVWEKFADIDHVFHVRWQALKEFSVTVYYPIGRYDREFYYYPTSSQVKVGVGKQIARPAPWYNPLVEVDKEVLVPAQDGLRKLLFTEVPILSGPVWLINTMRQISIRNVQEGVGYYEWFGLKNRDDYFRLIGLDEKLAVKLFQEWRAVVEKSGISQQNRQLVLLRATTGYVWGTLDTFKQQNRGIAKRNLRRGEFDHDAEEWIGHLPNGLPVTSLVAAKDNDAAKVKAGDLQESAPDKIGPDNSSLNLTNDHRVHVGISCWRCHGIQKDYVRPFDDWARKTFQRGVVALVDYDRRVQLELEYAYLRDIGRLVERDREDYSYAISALTSTGAQDRGLTVAGFTRIYAEAWNQYVNDGVTLEVAAQEYGVTPKVLAQALYKYNKSRGASDMVMVEFIKPKPGTISRLEFEDSFTLGAATVFGYAQPEIITKVKRFR